MRSYSGDDICRDHRQTDMIRNTKEPNQKYRLATVSNTQHLHDRPTKTSIKTMRTNYFAYFLF